MRCGAFFSKALAARSSTVPCQNIASDWQQQASTRMQSRLKPEAFVQPGLPHIAPGLVRTASRAAPHLRLRSQRSYSRPSHSVVCRASGDEIQAMALEGAYDAEINASVWERRPVPVIARLITIAIEFIQWQIRYPGGGPEDDGAGPVKRSREADRKAREQRTRRAAGMRELLVRLGPAFVKIGQALSSRPDILPPAYLVELEALQDRIPAFDSRDAFKVLEEELGAPVAATFSRISPAPVAAASLGQVYRATLARDGAEVAVKIQRPGVAEAIALDVFILRWLAAAFRKLRKLNTDLPALVDEWATSLFRELDYRTEAANAVRFKELYSQLEGVYVPAVYTELTTAKVLMLEWVDGERLRTVADNVNERAGGPPRRNGAAARRGSPVDDLALVEVGVRCSLEQMLEQGFYHADPHPGNLLKTADGRLCYIDFGMCGELDKKTRQALVRATLHLVNREYGYLAQDFIDLGLLPPGSDKQQIVPALTGVFQQALAGGVSNVSFGDLSGQLGRTMYQFSFRIPAYYTLLVRSLTVLEGIALASNPNYKVLGSAYPWIARRLLINQTPELRATLRALLYTPSGRFRFARLESLLQEAVRTPTPLPPALVPTAITGAGVRGGASGGGSSALALLLSPEASFVRGILVDEMAKGLDAAWRVSIDSAIDSALHPLPAVARIPVLGPLLVPLVSPCTSRSPPWNPWGAPPVRASTKASGPNEGTRASGLTSQDDAYLAGPAGSLLAALPKLSSAEDQEQLDGMSRLVNAVSALATTRQQTAVGSAGAGPGPEAGLDALTSQLAEAAAALQWLVSEMASLPEAQRLEALKLPSDVAAQFASRLAARTIRGIVNPGDSGAAGAGRQVPAGEKEEADERDAPVPEASPSLRQLDTPGPRGGNRDAVQNVLAGSSIV